MQAELSFDRRIAVITGAGRGLGRAYALALARRGARVVVNDLGVSMEGDDPSSDAADQVVAEIRSAGGTAVPNYDNVSTEEGGGKIVAAALDAFGGVDILVNNAGIGEDRPFEQLTMADFRKVLDCHLFGSAAVTHAAWPVFLQQRYGRVVMTASTAGFWGIANIAAYCAGKAGVVGLAKGLAHEGEPFNVRVNCVAPGAKTRMSEHHFEGRSGYTWRPELVVPAVLYLASDVCSHNGAVFAALAGRYARIEAMQGEGFQFDARSDVTPESFVARLAEIESLTGARSLEHGVSDAVRSAGK